MLRPYSLASRDRSSVRTSVPSTPQISLAISSSRQLFDISPGQVCSLAARAIDDQDARRRALVVMLGLRLVDRRLGRDPVDRQIVVGIGEARARLLRCRDSCGSLDSRPRRPPRPCRARRAAVERGIGELRQEALCEIPLRRTCDEGMPLRGSGASNALRRTFGLGAVLPAWRSGRGSCSCPVHRVDQPLAAVTYRSISSRVGSSIASLTRTRKVTASRPSTRRWS